ncbi:MAG TPA: peroxiredoxin-like family protein [Flavisolibacter sp.]|nr:peroxiredoxin-like family protein [Flavisolibacter sp.]
MKKVILSFLSLYIVLIAVAQEKPEGLFLNSKAPDFKLKDQSGIEVSLKELRKKGQTVVMFYRGNWCPYCSKQLKAFSDSLHLISAKGAQLVAITPEASGGIDSTIAKTGAVFPILYDEGAKMAAAYQVNYKLDDRTVSRYKMTGVDLLKHNNQKQVVLPVPAVYIINSEGSVTYRYFDENYKKRVSVAEILKNIK